MTAPLVLGIETSCDETGAGLVRGHALLADAVASSVDEHARFGGVVPEVASRAHLQAMVPSVHRALATAGVRPSDVDRVVRLSSELRSNGTHAKAVFACALQNVWQEYDLPANLPGTQLLVGRRFHLKPVAHLLGAFPRLASCSRGRAVIAAYSLGD